MKGLFLALLLASTSFLHSLQVICLHGFSGFPKKMVPIARVLKIDGHGVHVWGYPSKDKTIREHVDDLVVYLKEKANAHPNERFAFVSHSLGGILLRGAFNHPECPKEMLHGRLVMIAPPNQGCKFARKAGEYALVRKWMGDAAGKELTEEGFESVGEVPDTIDTLVIAGKSRKNFLVGGDNDGLIKVKETFLNTPHQHAIVRDDHNQIVYNRHVLTLVRKHIKMDKL